MSAALPTPADARQLASLRALQVRRAGSVVRQAQALCEQAAAAIDNRRRRIDRVNLAIQHLSQEAAHRFGHTMPRWIAVTTAERRRLNERLEREEFALADEMVEHEQASDELSRARAMLARAMTRQEITDDLARQSMQQHERIQEANTATESDEAFAAVVARNSR